MRDRGMIRTWIHRRRLELSGLPYPGSWATSCPECGLAGVGVRAAGGAWAFCPRHKLIWFCGDDAYYGGEDLIDPGPGALGGALDFINTCREVDAWRRPIGGRTGQMKDQLRRLKAQVRRLRWLLAAAVRGQR